jgi:hypothetical protein
VKSEISWLIRILPSYQYSRNQLKFIEKWRTKNLLIFDQLSTFIELAPQTGPYGRS